MCLCHCMTLTNINVKSMEVTANGSNAVKVGYQQKQFVVNACMAIAIWSLLVSARWSSTSKMKATHFQRKAQKVLITSLPLIALTHTINFSFHFLSVYACFISCIITNCERQCFSMFEKVFYHNVYGTHYCFVMWGVSWAKTKHFVYKKLLVFTNDP